MNYTQQDRDRLKISWCKGSSAPGASTIQRLIQDIEELEQKLKTEYNKGYNAALDNADRGMGAGVIGM